MKATKGKVQYKSKQACVNNKICHVSFGGRFSSGTLGLGPRGTDRPSNLKYPPRFTYLISTTLRFRNLP